MEEIRLKSKAMAIKGLFTLLLLLLTLCGGTTYGLWRLMRPLSLGEVRVWAIVSTLALVFAVPGAAFVAFLFGRREASIMTDGLRVGVNEVTRAADEVTTFKDKAASRSKQPSVQIAVAPQLPQPQIFHKQIEGRETVDL